MYTHLLKLCQPKNRKDKGLHLDLVFMSGLLVQVYPETIRRPGFQRKVIVRRTTSSYNLSSGSATFVPSLFATAVATASIVDIPSGRRCSRRRSRERVGAGRTNRGMAHNVSVRVYNRRAWRHVASRTTIQVIPGHNTQLFIDGQITEAFADSRYTGAALDRVAWIGHGADNPDTLGLQRFHRIGKTFGQMGRQGGFDFKGQALFPFD